MPLLEDLGIDLCDESTRSVLALVAMTATMTATMTFAILSLIRTTLYPPGQSVIPNPLRSKIPSLPPKEVARLDYGPDAYPGARDVSTPVCS